MGMTIDESISIFEAKGKYSLTEKENEAKEVAIETMRKYQKIQEIVKAWNDNNSFDSMIQISGVIEDGSENNHHASNT